MSQPFAVRAAREDDRGPLAALLAQVAEERDGIGVEPPVDVEQRARDWDIEGTMVAVAGGELVGSITVHQRRPTLPGDLALIVAGGWRGRGVGSALLDRAIAAARARGLHKLSLEVFPHNAPALALYRKFGFVEEGHRVAHVRRQSGELWDSVEMGLLLERGA